MDMPPPRLKKPVPALPPDTFSKRWKVAYKQFDVAAGALQPNDTTATAHRDPVLVAFRKKVTTALENKDLEKAIRQAELAIPSTHLDNTQLSKLQFAVQDVMTEYNAYEKLMTQVIVVQGMQLSNNRATKYKAALKTLITEVKVIHRDLKQEITKARMADEESVEAYKQNAALNIQRTKCAAEKALTFIKSARADKDKITDYNNGIQTAARDIAQQRDTLDKLA